jgi:hypothetical protein
MRRIAGMLLLVVLGAPGCNTREIAGPPPPGFVDARGGQVQTDDGQVTVDVPADAVDTLTQITVTPYAGALPASVIAGTAWKLEPEGLTFAQPVRIAIRYTPADVPAGAWLRLVQVDPQSLTLGGTWRPHVEETTVRGETTHLSVYAIADLSATTDYVAISAPPQSKADILFMIDNSSSALRTVQEALPALFPAFLAPLQSLDPPLDMHLGIITSDMGAGEFAVPQCSPGGSGGLLQLTPSASPSCANVAMTDASPYLVYHAGGAEANFTGTLEDAFACYAAVGDSGCGFEQPLASIRAALEGCNLPPDCTDIHLCDGRTQNCTQPRNDGFLRPDASLAVVVITDEDDCSVPADSTLFDPANPTLDSELGPLTSYRCFEFGVLCGGNDVGRTAGARTGCEPGTKEPGTPSHQLVPVESYAYFLKSLKPDPRLVSLAILAGPPTPVTVGLDEQGNPDLQPSCTSSTLAADPAIRLTKLARQFDADRASFVSLCNDDLAGAMGQLGAQVQHAATLAWCLGFAPADVDPAPGLQPDCAVTTSALGALPACSDAPGATCYSIGSAPNCAQSGVSLQIMRGPGVSSVGAEVRLQCTTLAPR